MADRVELLAPAGSFEALVAAVENGADAVYLGGRLFNARQFADNFDDEKLKEAVDYAHLRGVKVYLTLNILLTNREIAKLADYLVYIYAIGIDGVIVQDLGVARFIREVIPEMPLHASTQMTIHNLEGAKELEKLGFERVVLARELSLDEIKYICDNTSLEVEVFIHGALCVCYSGQCLMSSMIGGRSGNRGRCAQPCRLQYSLGKSSGYLLSPKDLCTVHDIGDIIDAGVKSLKVEGRMKRPEYVTTVIGIYRKYIDQFIEGKPKEVSKEDVEDLQQIFNRGGFTKGYFYGKAGRSMMSFEKPNNWGVYLGNIKDFDSKKKMMTIKLQTVLSVGDGIEIWGSSEGVSVSKMYKGDTPVDSANPSEIVSIPVNARVESGAKVYKTSSVSLLERARQSYKEGTKKNEVYGHAEIMLGTPMSFKVWDDENNFVEVVGTIPSEQAVNRPLTTDRLMEQLGKLGGTPFVFNSLEVDIQEGVTIPISEINNIRREAVEKLSALKINKHVPKSDIESIRKRVQGVLKREPVKKKEAPRLSVYFNRINVNLQELNIKVDRIYIPVTEYIANKDAAVGFIKKQKALGAEIFAAMPRIYRQSLHKVVKKSIDELIDIGIDGLLMTGIGQENFAKKIGLAADFSFNVFNNFTVDQLQDRGISTFALSPELNISQAKEIISYSPICGEVIVYGKLPLMVSEYCPVGCTVGGFEEEKKCNRCCSKEEYELVDRMGNKMPVLTDPITCQSQILNSKTLFLGGELAKVLDIGPAVIRLNFTNEDVDEIIETVNFHKDYLRNGKGIVKDYGEYIEKTKDNFTKGHYFRGVE